MLGPPSPRIAHFAAADLPPGAGGEVGGDEAACSVPGKKKSRVYEGKAVWDETYRGVVSISLESARYEVAQMLSARYPHTSFQLSLIHISEPTRPY